MSSDYLLYCRRARTKLGEEYNAVREKLLLMNDIVRQLEEKEIEDNLRGFTIASLTNNQLQQVSKLADEDVREVRYNSKEECAAVVTKKNDVVFVDYNATMDILTANKQ
jgi:hypothetical protein